MGPGAQAVDLGHAAVPRCAAAAAGGWGGATGARRWGAGRHAQEACRSRAVPQRRLERLVPRLRPAQESAPAPVLISPIPEAALNECGPLPSPAAAAAAAAAAACPLRRASPCLLLSVSVQPTHVCACPYMPAASSRPPGWRKRRKLRWRRACTACLARCGGACTGAPLLAVRLV